MYFRVLDCAVYGSLQFFFNFLVHLPTVTFDSETNMPSTDLETLIPLKINSLPSAITFTVFNG